MSAIPLETLLAQNGCLFAGAGAGKTHGLLTAALGLLGGAGGSEPLRPGRLCLLTFTEKAAAEMRERLRARVESLAEGRGGEEELDRAFAARGQPSPPASFWRTVQAQLDSATLSTFHAYCARLLRQAPAGSGIPSSFELLGEEDATTLLVDTAEQCVLDFLDAGDADVEALCAQADLRGVGRGRGLLDLLVAAVVRLREEGRSAAGLPVGDPDEAGATLLRAVERGELAVAQARTLAQAAASPEAAALEACLDVLHGLDADAPAERLARLEALAAGLPRAGRNGLREACSSARDALLEGTLNAPGVLSAYAGCKAIQHERTLRRLCDAVEAAYRAALRRGGWMDFAELLIAARDVLRDDRGFRAGAQARIGALLVDEVQDTNGLQLELVVLLAEVRAGGPRPVAKERAAVLALPLEPRFLLAVGDRKQSIYDFRGADVSTFEHLARKMVEEGGARHYLRDNRRSQPALLEVLNAAARAALPELPQPSDYEVVFSSDEDGLLAVRSQVGPSVCVDALPVVPAARGAAREGEADVLARWLAFLLSEEAPPTVVEGGVLRRARGGDIAILLRSFSGLEAYREALRAQRIPHRVLRELNPYTSPAVLDAAALLSFLADDRDALSLAAVLRSPFVGLSDASLARLAQPGRLDRRSLEEALPAAFPPDEAARLLRWKALVESVWALKQPLPLAELLDLFFQETGYRTAVAASPEPDEPLAALERLLTLARSWDARGRGNAGALARRLWTLGEQTTVTGASGLEQARAADAVQLLSIHAAKGLQWPVVCVADLSNSGTRTPSDRLLLDRHLGFAFKPQGPFDAEPRKTPRWLALQAELKRRDRAEAGRLLYVALTRAQDRLVLSGGAASPEAWRTRLEPALGALDVAPFVQKLRLEEIPPARPLALVAEEPRDLGSGQVELARIRKPLRPKWQGVALEAAALEDFRRCPRRSWLLQTVGLEPSGSDVGDGAPSAPLPVRHRAARGQLLETLAASLSVEDFAAGVPESVLSPHLTSLGLSLGEARALGVVSPLRALAATRAVRHAAAAGLLSAGVELELEALPALLLAKVTLVWEEASVLHLLRFVPGSLPPLGLEAFQVTTSVLWHAGSARASGCRVGLSFVDTPDAEPHWLDRPALSPAALGALANGFLQASAHGQGVRPASECDALGCGFRNRCHPPPPGL